MKVFFLGAGASIPAGYPGMAELLKAVDQHVQKTPSEEVRTAWHNFKAFRDRAPEVIKRILSSTNPEIVLSLLQLYEAARENEELDRWCALAAPDHEWNSNRYQQLKDQIETRPEEFLEAKNAVVGWLRCVEEFFWWRHVCDDDPVVALDREYLRQELHLLRRGDVVITTNWDTLAERILAEGTLWSPCDGYGFHADLVCEGVARAPAESVLQPSEVKVFKLHGSLGWHRSTDGGTVTLSHSRFLQKLGLKDRSGRFLSLRDQAEPRGLPLGDWLVLPPSYLKQFAVGTMQSIWAQAAHALTRAEEIHIIGYSLPASDLAIQALLNPLRLRLDGAEVSVIVNDPKPETRQRWRRLLGENAKIFEQGVGP